MLHKGETSSSPHSVNRLCSPLIKLYPPTQLLLLTLDVIRPSDITAAFTRTQEVFRRIDLGSCSVMLQGFGMFGEVESTSGADARALFEVDFWGVVGVSRAAIKFFREVNPPGKGGVLLQHSSMMAFLARAWCCTLLCEVSEWCGSYRGAFPMIYRYNVFF